MRYGTRNFKLETDKKLACTCKHAKCDKRLFKQEYLEKLQLIRDDIKIPLIITSGGRCQHHPSEVNKKTIGDHQKGAAVDIAYSEKWQLTKLLVLAGRHGATRVAYGKSFVHIAWTETDRTDIPTWEYS